MQNEIDIKFLLPVEMQSTNNRTTEQNFNFMFSEFCWNSSSEVFNKNILYICRSGNTIHFPLGPGDDMIRDGHNERPVPFTCVY